MLPHIQSRLYLDTMDEYMIKYFYVYKIIKGKIMVTFTAYLFDGKKTAQKVLEELEDSSKNYMWIDDVAVVSKSDSGRLSIHSTWAQDETGAAGFGWGAFTGALLGMMAGPGGALAGATLGGSIWGLWGVMMDDIFNDPKLDLFASNLKKNTSALVLVSDETYLNDYEVTMAPYEGTLIQTELDEADVDYMRKKLASS